MGTDDEKPCHTNDIVQYDFDSGLNGRGFCQDLFETGVGL